MIKTETMEVNGRRLVKTYSDAGMMVENSEGVLYDEAIDPEESGRVYTESTTPVSDFVLDDADALSIITGGDRT